MNAAILIVSAQRGLGFFFQFVSGRSRFDSCLVMVCPVLGSCVAPHPASPFSAEYRGEGELERRGTLNRSGLTRTQETRSMRLVFPPFSSCTQEEKGTGDEEV